VLALEVGLKERQRKSNRYRFPQGRPRSGKPYDERTPPPFFTFDVKLRMMPLQHVLDDCEPQSRSARIA
jgi:hypothetical protein